MKNKSNKSKSIELKNKYSSWKREQLNENTFFVIFTDFLTSNKLKEISGNALKLYIYLGLNSDNMNGDVWHGTEKIAKYFEKSERTIRNWFKELQESNLIYRMQLEFNGNAYTYLMPYSNVEENKSYVLKYRFNDINLRKNKDLRDYRRSIVNGVKAIFPMAEIAIGPDIFSIRLDREPSNLELRKMGYEIKSRDSRYEALAKEYLYKDKNGIRKKSIQLFRRFK